MNPLHRLLLAPLLAGVSVVGCAQTPPAETRGQLLYTTHCIGCHTTQIHWRSDRQAQDWDGLKWQVNRWQANAGLAWDDADITAVARHLNESIYHFPQTFGRASLGARPAQPSTVATGTSGRPTH